MKNLIIVPTYWTLKENGAKEDFDHPAPIGEEGTLARLLKSFRTCRVKTEIHIVVAPLCSKTEKKVRSITNDFPDLDIHVFTRVDMERVLRYAKKCKFSSKFISKLKCNSYGSIRNQGLIIGLMKDVDNIIFLDDDEVIEDKKYMVKADDCIGKKIGRRRLVGKTGYYVDKDNNYRPLKRKDPAWKKHWLKNKHLNKTVNSIRSKKRFHETSSALGGNMVINKELFSVVPFDPYIARGEDLDYLLNAKHFKFLFLFDNQLVVKHLPPALHLSYWRKIQKDVFRFVYEKEKIKYFNFGIEELDSYPKFFLNRGLYCRAVTTNIELAKHYLKHNDKRGFNESLKNAKSVQCEAKTYAKKYAPEYFLFQKEWARFSLRIKKYF